jgi:hypothetical protein|tara:strand:- start:2898 stop:3068 length:171 start_codon:yes stop_codon:yes gene_type:complete
MDCNIGDNIEFKTDKGLKILTINNIIKKDNKTRYFGKINGKLWSVPPKAITRLVWK